MKENIESVASQESGPRFAQCGTLDEIIEVLDAMHLGGATIMNSRGTKEYTAKDLASLIAKQLSELENKSFPKEGFEDVLNALLAAGGITSTNGFRSALIEAIKKATGFEEYVRNNHNQETITLMPIPTSDHFKEIYEEILYQ